MKRATITTVAIVIASTVLIAAFLLHQDMTVVERILKSNPANEFSDDTYDILVTKLTTPGAISDDQFEDLTRHSLDRAAHDDAWLFTLLLESTKNKPQRAFAIRKSALEFINQGKDAS